MVNELVSAPERKAATPHFMEYGVIERIVRGASEGCQTAIGGIRTEPETLDAVQMPADYTPTSIPIKM